MDYKKSHAFLFGGIGLGIICCCLAKYLQIFYIVGFVLVALAAMQGAIYYRCPHCKVSLFGARGRGNVPKQCPKCGKDLS